MTNLLFLTKQPKKHILIAQYKRISKEYGVFTYEIYYYVKKCNIKDINLQKRYKYKLLSHLENIDVESCDKLLFQFFCVTFWGSHFSRVIDVHCWPLCQLFLSQTDGKTEGLKGKSSQYVIVTKSWTGANVLVEITIDGFCLKWTEKPCKPKKNFLFWSKFKPKRVGFDNRSLGFIET